MFFSSAMVCISVCLLVCLFIGLSVYWSVCWIVCLLVCLSVGLSVCLSVGLTVDSSVDLSVKFSVKGWTPGIIITLGLQMYAVRPCVHILPHARPCKINDETNPYTFMLVARSCKNFVQHECVWTCVTIYLARPCSGHNVYMPTCVRSKVMIMHLCFTF